jgi:cell division protein FtsQ
VSEPVRRVRRLRLPSPRQAAWSLVVAALCGCAAVAGMYAQQNWGTLSADAEEFVARQIGAKVEKILVSGVVNTSQADLLTALALKKGDTLVGFSASAARDRVEALDWVESASVVRELPSTVRIDIIEKKPLALLAMNDGDWIIDREGQLISPANDDFGHLPLLRGKGAAEQASALFALLAEIPEVMKNLQGATYVGDRRWDVQFVNEITVMLPEENPAKALRLLATLAQVRKIFDARGTVVDLRAPDRVVLRQPKDDTVL